MLILDKDSYVECNAEVEREAEDSGIMSLSRMTGMDKITHRKNKTPKKMK